MMGGAFTHTHMPPGGQGRRTLAWEGVGFPAIRDHHGFPDGSLVKNLPANPGHTVPSLFWKDPTRLGATKLPPLSTTAIKPVH